MFVANIFGPTDQARTGSIFALYYFFVGCSRLRAARKQCIGQMCRDRLLPLEVHSSFSMLVPFPRVRVSIEKILLMSMLLMMLLDLMHELYVSSMRVLVLPNHHPIKPAKKKSIHQKHNKIKKMEMHTKFEIVVVVCSSSACSTNFIA